MNIAFIMRGLPGSGKSTVAESIRGEFGVIHSTDDYFYIDGEYQFDPSKLQEYHDLNFAAFCKSLHNHVPIVICDNTNIKRSDYERYEEAAKGAGYLIAFVVMPHPAIKEATERNTHGVNEEVIQKMLAEWE